MDNQDAAGGCLALIMLIATGASWIGSGLISWSWLEPDSFGQVLLFIIVWGILGKVFDVILTGILIALASLFQ